MGPLRGAVGTDLTLYQDSSSRRKSAATESQSVVLVRDENDIQESLNLSPFIVDKGSFVSDRIARVYVLAHEEADSLVYIAVDRSVFEALRRPDDRIRTDMTMEELSGGTDEPGGTDDDWMPDPVSSRGSTRKVFGLLKGQYDSMKADFAT
jgi:hypothetical protein